MSDPQPLPFVDGVYCGAVWQWTRTSTGTWMRRASSQEDWRAVEGELATTEILDALAERAARIEALEEENSRLRREKRTKWWGPR